MIIVSNTSPLSNLALVKHLFLLEQIYGKIIIPQAVYNELTHPDAGEIIINSIKSAQWLEIYSVINLEKVRKLQEKIHLGEAEAIVLALELNANELLIDERLGRIESEALGINITGILGILLIAKNRNLIIKIKPILDDLINKASFRVSQQLYHHTLELADEL
jgi:uncharacterized protein